ncbi:hydrolase [Burkholderia sp. Leaf177]|uniref:alpha/beta fold hydrolase n=1 Tax=Burkholderia sp. Leaf177 TaxID=1736287 RepID=UPI0006F51C4B|nr:alpha/beta hydrolase [Burkholderia sp. Leaf177]KQR77194.1 hydrolase [Burkholderia sp. Leaf177]
MNGVTELGGKTFKRRFVRSGDIRFHMVDGGVGPTVVLIAGFPQTAYAWRRVQPLLAGAYRTIAIDLPGQGYSDKPTDGYDTQTAARRIHDLLQQLSVGRHFYVGHDIGSWIAYPYAHDYAADLDGIVFIDGNIPGITLKAEVSVTAPSNWKSWHFLFNAVDDLPEALIAGRERILIEWFFNRKTANAMATFEPADVDQYVKAYASPGGLRGMLGYYRAVEEDMRQNQKLFANRIKPPVLALGGDVGSAPTIHELMKPLCENLQGGVIEDCGHYIPEEQPEALAAELMRFFNGCLG